VIEVMDHEFKRLLFRSELNIRLILKRTTKIVGKLIYYHRGTKFWIFESDKTKVNILLICGSMVAFCL